MESENKTKKIFVIIVLVLSFIPLILFIIYYQYSDEINSTLGIKKDYLKKKKEKEKEKEKEKKRFRSPSGKLYPYHWGAPPQRGTRDIRKLPYGYGRGSSTLSKWIRKKYMYDWNKMKGKILKTKSNLALALATAGASIVPRGKKRKKPLYKWFEDSYKKLEQRKGMPGDKPMFVEFCKYWRVFDSYQLEQCIPECKKIKDDKIRKVCLDFCKFNKITSFDKKEKIINEMGKDPLVFKNFELKRLKCMNKNCSNYKNFDDKKKCTMGCFLKYICHYEIIIKYLISKNKCIPECKKNIDGKVKEGKRHGKGINNSPKYLFAIKHCINDCRRFQQSY